MLCPKCQHENREEAKFCEGCGAKLALVCPNCGSELRPQARFCDECGTKVGDVADKISIPKLEDMRNRLYIPESIRKQRDAAELELQGENRLVTALFADISGFSQLSNQNSSDKVVNIVNDCFKTIVDIIFKYEGDPNRFIGDNVLAFFGAPIAHENDPERAIISALEIMDRVKNLSLNVSIGINTGMMYFGQIGTRDHLEISAYGPDINLAKRLQEIANPGQILVGPGTYKFTKRAFDFQAIPSLTLKGIDKPITAYETLRLKSHPEKLRGIEGLHAEMIGREKEFTEIIDAVELWLSGQGQMVSIIGEAGIGKSRLVSELRSHIIKKHTSVPLSRGELEQYLILEGRCLSIGQPISYWPFIDMFRMLFDFKEDDSESDTARKVREVIIKLFPIRAEEILPFIGHLMSIKFGDELDRKLESYTSEQIRHQMMVRLRDVFMALAKQNPLLLILEDLHWSDDLSLDLLSMLMDELVTNQLMLVCVYRPEQEHRCYKLSTLAQRKCFESYTEVPLQKLSRVQSNQLVQTLLAIDCLSDEVRDMILRKSEGNPFFIEEVIRSLIDKGLVYRDEERWVAKEGISNIDVPDTIQGVIMERVDRLESETKYVLQCASVIGRLFRYSLLSHLTSHERRLDNYLQELESKDLVYEERSIPELEYTFKHALTQEATYQTILEQRRKGFHLQVAESIERLYIDKIEDFYEELAHHYKYTDNKEKTIEYIIKSGIKLASNFANNDAVKYFDEAEELIDKSKLPHHKEKSLLYENRGQVLQYIGNWTKALKDYQEAIKWCDDPHNRAEIYRKMGWLEAEEMQDKVLGKKHLEIGLRELPEDDRSIEKIRLKHDLLWTCLGMTEFENPFLFGQEALKMAEEMGYRQEQAILCAYLDNLQRSLGDFSVEYEQKAMSIVNELGDNSRMAWVCFILGLSRHLGFNDKHILESAESYYIKAREIAERVGYLYLLGYAHSALGTLYLDIGQDDQCIENFDIGIDLAAKTKSIFPLIFGKNLMFVYARQDREDMVNFTFTRIMRIFNSIEIDDESWAKVSLHGGVMTFSYFVFYIGHKIMGKNPKFKSTLLKILEKLLEETKSQVQKAWCHNMLMLLNYELGNKDSAEYHAKEIISIIEKAGYPDYMSVFHFAYMLIGNATKAIEMERNFVAILCDTSTLIDELFILHWIETAYFYERFGHNDVLQVVAKQLQQNMPEKLRKQEFSQLVPESVKLENFETPQLYDCFIQDPIETGWEWINPSDNCSYELEKVSSLMVTLSKNYDIANSPRFLRPLSSDFTIETVIFNGIENQKCGGILVEKDKKNMIRIYTESNYSWYTDIVLYDAFLDGKYKNILIYPINSEKIWLRLERRGDRFSGYVSSDGNNWFSCGYIDAQIGDSVKVGISAFPPKFKQTSTRFEYFKIY